MAEGMEVDGREKEEEEKGIDSCSESRLFSSFKHLGLVSTDVPCLLRYVHKRRENLIVTCTGTSVSTFAGQQLKLISSTEDRDDIQCMASDTYHVYTAGKGQGDPIRAWRRGAELAHEYSTKNHMAHITHLLPFADNLVSVDWAGLLSVFNIKSEEIMRIAQLPIAKNRVTAVMHPLTFQNKILIGYSDGLMHLWNINTNSLIHQFDRFQGKTINAVVQAPAMGVVAIALSSCEVHMFNLEFDKILLTLKSVDEPLSVAFRTDGHDVVMLGGRKGTISAWDLNEKNMICFANDAHKAPVIGLVSFMSEPIFVSSAADNTLKVWILDKPDGGFRLLNSREGHRMPPTTVRFHGDESPSIISTGMDNTLRTFHLHNETYNRIISNFTSHEKKGSRGIEVNAFTNYGGYHQPIAEDIVAFNNHSPSELYTFSFQDSKRGKSILANNEKETITCAEMTADQQWVLVGLKSGVTQIYNMQSKRLKSTIVPTNVKDTVVTVTGLALSSTESLMLIGRTNSVSFHDFPGGTQRHLSDLNWPLRQVFTRHSTNLCGLVLADFEIMIVDITTNSVVRRLRHCRSPITDATFSSDIKWLTAATTDGCIFTWDVPTGNLIDVFRNFNSPVTSLDYSPRNDFLVTAHADEVAIKLWVNKTVFDVIPPLLPISEDYYPMRPEDIIPMITDGLSLERDSDVIPTHSSKGLPSLGIFPKFHWKELLNLNQIRLRNKPAPAFKPKTIIPFILSELDKERTKSLLDGNENAQETPLPSAGRVTFLTPFATELTETIALKEDGQLSTSSCNSLLTKLADMGPSQMDLEIRSWDPEGGGSVALLEDFLLLATYATHHQEHLQVVQTSLALFYKLYHKSIRKYQMESVVQSLMEDLHRIRSDMLKSSCLIESLIDYNNETLF